MLIAFYKPYGVLSQFTPEPGSRWRTLAEFGLPPRVYALGRLDADSEGLLLLSDEAGLNHRLLNPTQGHRRCYWAMVERVPSENSLKTLRDGVVIGGHSTRPCGVNLLPSPPSLLPRNPPVRYRKNVPDAWVELELTEGKNRQVRRMTAAVGHPTLRLHRAQIGNLSLATLALKPGEFTVLDTRQRESVFES